MFLVEILENIENPKKNKKKHPKPQHSKLDKINI